MASASLPDLSIPNPTVLCVRHRGGSVSSQVVSSHGEAYQVLGILMQALSDARSLGANVEYPVSTEITPLLGGPCAA